MWASCRRAAVGAGFRWSSRTTAAVVKRRVASVGGARRAIHAPVLSKEVEAACAEGRAVVALESTIISHGMPYPANVETAMEVEGIVRSHGAVPATIAIMDGQVCVGLEEEQLEHLGRHGPATRKCSRRDIAVCVANGETGATTVAGTMVVAAMVPGIHVFVTGGLGGVHRGHEHSLDVSADLTELARTPLAVVCAGVKSILDIGKTLEVLETNGVTVTGYQTDEFPAFWSPSSGFKVPSRADTADGVAAIIEANVQLALGSGMVVGVPYTQAGAQAAEFEAATQEALQEAQRQGISGKEVTPFLLKHIVERTEGRSLEANVALVKNNAHVGSQVATALAARLQSSGRSGVRQFSTAAVADTPPFKKPPVVIGGAVHDIVARPHGDAEFVIGTSNPGVVERSFGGVARNIAEAMARLGTPPELVTVIGESDAAILANCKDVGIATENVVRSSNGRSATYAAMLNDQGDLVGAVADMECFEELSTEQATRGIDADTPVVVVDANPREETIRGIAEHCARMGVPLWFEPTSVPKAGRIVSALHATTVLSPNADEVTRIAKAVIGVEEDAEDDSDDPNELSSDDEDEAEEVNVSGSDAQDGSYASMLTRDGDLVDVKEEDVENSGSADEEETEVDGAMLASAQMILAAMCTPVEEADGSLTHGGLVDGRKHVVVTLGAQGSLWLSGEPQSMARRHDEDIGMDHLMEFFDKGKLDMMLLPTVKADMVNCTGAGDTLVGAAAMGIAWQWPMGACITVGNAAASLAVQSAQTVPSTLDLDDVMRLCNDGTA